MHARIMICAPVPCLLIFMASFALAQEEGFWIPREPPRAHYTIDCSIDTAAETVKGSETIRFVNSTDKPFHRLALSWAASKGRIIEITANGKGTELLAGMGPWSPREPIPFILAEPLGPGEAMELRVNFESALKKRRGQILLSGWQPRLWWGVPGWARHNHDDFDVKIAVTPGYAIAATGRLDPASGYYRAKDVRSFGIFLGEGHQVMEADAGDVQVRCLHTAEGRQCAQVLLDTAVDVVNFYRERFGFYPYKILNIIPGEKSPMGGYPFTTSIVVVHGQESMSRRDDLHWKWITAHEIGHQYFGEWVLERDAPEWLWIGMGIFADREYVRSRGLNLKRHHGLMQTYMDGVIKGYDTTIDIPPAAFEKISFDFNNVVTHGKGFAIISALDCLLGDETFNRIYLRCLSDYAGRRLGTADFQRICEEESGQALDWFFDQWIRSNKFLCYEIVSKTSSVECGQNFSVVHVKCKGTLKMPIPVQAVFEDGTTQIQFTERLEQDNRVCFRSDSPLKEVKLDPDQELAMLAELPPSVQVMAFVKRIKDLPWTGSGVKALETFKEARDVKLPDPHVWFRLGVKLFDGKYYDEALEVFRKARDHEGARYRDLYRVWEGHLLDLAGDRKAAVAAYQDALKNWSGSTMRHDQYGMVINQQWIKERIETPFKRP